VGKIIRWVISSQINLFLAIGGKHTIFPGIHPIQYKDKIYHLKVHEQESINIESLGTLKTDDCTIYQIFTDESNQYFLENSNKLDIFFDDAIYLINKFILAHRLADKVTVITPFQTQIGRTSTKLILFSLDTI